jgi:hypothetical protein
MDHLSTAWKLATEHSQLSREASHTRNSDKRYSTNQYPVGAQVWLASNVRTINNSVRNESKKFAARWTGPYRVVEVHPPVNLRLMDSHHKVSPGLVHIRRVKPYHAPLDPPGELPLIHADEERNDQLWSPDVPIAPDAREQLESPPSSSSLPSPASSNGPSSSAAPPAAPSVATAPLLASTETSSLASPPLPPEHSVLPSDPAAPSAPVAVPALEDPFAVDIPDNAPTALIDIRAAPTSSLPQGEKKRRRARKSNKKQAKSDQLDAAPQASRRPSVLVQVPPRALQPPAPLPPAKPPARKRQADADDLVTLPKRARATPLLLKDLPSEAKKRFGDFLKKEPTTQSIPRATKDLLRSLVSDFSLVMLPEKVCELNKSIDGISNEISLNRFLVRITDEFDTEFVDDLEQPLED